MVKDKTITLTRQYQVSALLYFMLFLINLLELIMEVPGWLRYFNMISIIAFLGYWIFVAISDQKETGDELSKQNQLKADSFVLQAITICILGIFMLLSIFVEPDYLISLRSNLGLSIFWFLGFSRCTAFLVYERVGRG